MLGGLGAVGAIAGVAAGALLPLAANLLQSGDEAGNLEDQLKALADSTGNMESAVASAAVPVEELRLKYKDLADEIARANGIAAGFASATRRRHRAASIPYAGRCRSSGTPSPSRRRRRSKRSSPRRVDTGRSGGPFGAMRRRPSGSAGAGRELTRHPRASGPSWSSGSGTPVEVGETC